MKNRLSRLTLLLLIVSASPRAQTLLDLDPGPGAPGSNPITFFSANGRTYFTAIDPLLGREMWVSDGTVPGTHLLKDINMGSGSGANFTVFGVLAGRVYFRADDGVDGARLWTTDGTEAGTHRVGPSQSGSPDPYEPFAVAGGLLYFATSGSELWATDGTEPGTRLVRNIVNSGSSSRPRFLTAFGDRILFSARTAAQGTELWVSDGTTAGTTVLADINPGPGGSGPVSFVRLGDRAFFRASDPEHGVELWATDGTAVGTVLVRDIEPGTGSSTPSGLVAVGSRVLFTARVTGLGEELWQSDGTAAGTSLVRDINPGSASSNQILGFSSARLGASIVFAAFTPATGNEFWISDGMEAGTRLLRDVNPGPSGSVGPETYQVLGGRVYVSATDGVHGAELWQTDGTTAGTVLTADLEPGNRGSDPDLEGGPPDSGGRLFFRALTDLAASEPWVLSAPASASLAFTGPGSYPFGAAVAASIAAPGAAAPGGAVLSADRFAEGPANAAGIADPFVLPARWVFRLSEGTLGDAELRFDVGAIAGASATMTAYRRSTPGGGPFAALPTRHDAATNALVVTGADVLGEVVLASATPIADEPEAGTLPGLTLGVPSPNPSRGSAALTLTLDAPQTVSVGVFDVLGREVARLHDGPLAAGTRALPLDTRGLPAGVYVVRAVAGGAVVSRQITVIR